MELKPRTTFFIEDYSLLINDEANREFKSLEEDGQQQAITCSEVNGKFIVGDGKHRMFYLKKLGRPIECILAHNTLKKEQLIMTLNAYTNNWPKNTYIEHLAKRNDNYSKFNEYIQKYKHLSDRTIYFVVQGNSRDLLQIIKNQQLVFNPSKEDDRILSELNLISSIITKERRAYTRKTGESLQRFDKEDVMKVFYYFLNKHRDKINSTILKDCISERATEFSRTTTVDSILTWYNKLKTSWKYRS